MKSIEKNLLESHLSLALQGWKLAPCQAFLGEHSLPTDSVPRRTDPFTQQLIPSYAFVASLVTKWLFSNKKRGSDNLNCGTQTKQDNKQQKDYLSAVNVAKTSKMLGCFFYNPFISMKIGNVSPQWSDCRKVLFIRYCFSPQEVQYFPSLLCRFFLLSTDFCSGPPHLLPWCQCV